MYIVCAVPTLLLSSYNPGSFGDQSITYLDAFRQLDGFGKFGLWFLIVAIVSHPDAKGILPSSEALLMYSPLFVLAVAIFVGPIFVLTRTSKLDRWLGDLSYPIYLSHVFVYAVMTALGRLGSGTSYAIALFATILVSAALHRLIDAPVARFRKSQLHAQETFTPALRPAE